MGNFKKTVNCPICLGKGERCAYKQESLYDQIVYHCRTDADVSGYKHIGISSIGFFKYVQETERFDTATKSNNAPQKLSQEQISRARSAEALERKLQQEYEKNRILSQLSSAERNAEYAKMLNSMSLTDVHRANLNGIRGFLPEQIKINGYKSVSRYQKINNQVSPKTPGVFKNELGNLKINYAGEGILIPVRDLEGNIIAFQIRNTEKSGNAAKYVWSGHPENLKTDAERKKEFYPSIHLQNGERPLHIANPHGLQTPEKIYLAEGVLKPDITAYRFKQVVIGSPGGSWYGSPEQLFTALEYFNTKNIFLYADAGAIINTNVMTMYNRTRQLLEHEGYKVSVAWWGQVSKPKSKLENGLEFCDIDELDNFHAGYEHLKPQFEKIQYISWDQYIDLAFSPEIAEKRPKTASGGKTNFIKEIEARESLQDLIENINGTAKNPWWESYKNLTKKPATTKTINFVNTQQPKTKTETLVFDQKIIDEFNFGAEFEEGNESNTKNIDSDRWSDDTQESKKENQQDSQKTEQNFSAANDIVNFDPLEAKKWNTWKRRIEYSPTDTFNTPYVSIPHKIYANNIYFINSGLGTGKTWWALEMLKQMGAPFLYITFRNSLCEQFIEQCLARGIECVHGNDNGFKYQNDTQSLQGLAFCIDSLHKVSLQNLDGKIIIVDESFATIQEMLTKKNLNKGRVKLLNFFKESMSKCAAAIFMDGNLTDSLTDYVSALAPEKKSIKFKNEFKGRKFDISFVNGSIDDITSDYYTQEEINDGVSANGEKIKIKVRDRSPVLQAIYNSMGNICIATDSIMQSMSLHKRFRDQGRFGIVANSISYRENWLLCESDPESSVQNFIKDVDGFIEKYKPDYVIYTPTAEAGIDISIHKRIPNYFCHQYCLFFNVIGTFGQSQMIARLRDPNCPRTVWLYPHPMGNSYDFTGCATVDYRNIFLMQQASYLLQLRKDAEQLNASVNELELLNEANKKTIETSKQEQIHSTLSSDIVLKIKYEKSMPRKCLLHLLKESGHNVTEVSLLESKKALELNKEAAESFKKEESENIANAEILDSKEYEIASTKVNISKETRFNLEKTAINFLVPGISDKSIWDADFVYLCKFQEKSFLAAQNRFYLFKNKESLMKGELLKYRNASANSILSNNYETVASDVNAQYLKLRLLQDQSNIDWFLNDQNQWYVKNGWFDDFDGEKFINRDNDPVADRVFGFLTFFNKNHQIFGKQFAIKKTAKNKNVAGTATKTITKIIEWLGCKVRGKKIAGIFRYSIDPESFNKYHQACQDCLKIKYSDQKVNPIPQTVLERGAAIFSLKIETPKPEKTYAYTTPYEVFKALEENWHDQYSMYAVLQKSKPSVVLTLATAPNSFYGTNSIKYVNDVITWGNDNLCRSSDERVNLPQLENTSNWAQESVPIV